MDNFNFIPALPCYRYLSSEINDIEYHACNLVGDGGRDFFIPWDKLCFAPNVLTIQCPKKVEGQFTIFQIIEHHTSLKDVAALKLMTYLY